MKLERLSAVITDEYSHEESEEFEAYNPQHEEMSEISHVLNRLKSFFFFFWIVIIIGEIPYLRESAVQCE